MPYQGFAALPTYEPYNYMQTRVCYRHMKPEGVMIVTETNTVVYYVEIKPGIRQRSGHSV